MAYKDPEKQKAYNKAYLVKYRAKHREKMNAYNRAWRKNHPHYLLKSNARAKVNRQLYPERFKEYSRKQGIKTRKNVKERLQRLRIEKGGCCARCGYKEYIEILHFHHVKSKGIEVTKLMREEAMRKEAAKCILLCPNCHAIKHLR